MPKSITPLIYYNTMFLLIASSEADRYAIDIYERSLKEGRISFTLRTMSEWCETHHIKVEAHFVWRRDYSVSLNILRAIEYCAWRSLNRKIINKESLAASDTDEEDSQ